ncbi:N-acetylmuramoyl-L-alanine amidase family protein [Bacillus coreaensis]
MITIVKIFIDPGHGGTDPGAVGNGIQEKNITLQISQKIREILEREYSNVEVRMSRTGDQSLSLKQRTDMANQWGANFLYSVHINSGGGIGYEDFIYSRLSNTSRTAQMQRTIHAEIVSRNGMTDRGAKKADFHMLRESNMDAILTENGFIDNPSDAAKMKNPTWIESTARGHVVGLEKVFNLTRRQGAQTQPQRVSTSPYKETGVIRYIYTGGFAGQALLDVHTFLTTKGYSFKARSNNDLSISFLIGPFDVGTESYARLKYFLDQNKHHNTLLTREEADKWR